VRKRSARTEERHVYTLVCAVGVLPQGTGEKTQPEPPNIRGEGVRVSSDPLRAHVAERAYSIDLKELKSVELWRICQGDEVNGVAGGEGLVRFCQRRIRITLYLYNAFL